MKLKPLTSFLSKLRVLYYFLFYFFFFKVKSLVTSLMPMFGLTHKERNGHVASLIQRLNQAYRADEIEAMAAVQAIEFATEIGLDRIVVEGTRR